LAENLEREREREKEREYEAKVPIFKVMPQIT
jgi:hypothetical protein